MREVEIPLSFGIRPDDVIQIIDQLINQDGRQITLRGSLKKYPGCVHWHLKQPRMSGTLEITYWPDQCRAWFTVQSGRKAAWINGAIEKLLSSMQTEFVRYLK